MFGLLAVITGCRQGNYLASSLPLEFQAPAVVDVQRLDLSRLASSTVHHNVVQPGDILEVSISTGLEEDHQTGWSTRVNENGTARIPLVGNVRLAGLQFWEADTAIGNVGVERGIYRNPNISVTLKQRRMNRVTVMGAVQIPGVHELPQMHCDLLTAIVAAGGLANDADTIVEIHRPAGKHANDAIHLARHLAGPAADTSRFRIDLVEATTSGLGNITLADGSIVTVGKVPARRLYVLGLVKRPSEYEMPFDRDLHLLDALAMAGGRTTAAADRVLIVRRVPHENRYVVIDASVRQAKRESAANLRLAPNDVVSVEETPITFLSGAMRNFLRFGFSIGFPGI